MYTCLSTSQWSALNSVPVGWLILRAKRDHWFTGCNWHECAYALFPPLVNCYLRPRTLFWVGRIDVPPPTKIPHSQKAPLSHYPAHHRPFHFVHHSICSCIILYLFSLSLIVIPLLHDFHLTSVRLLSMYNEAAAGDNRHFIRTFSGSSWQSKHCYFSSYPCNSHSNMCARIFVIECYIRHKSNRLLQNHTG